jgi:hypothetical protein
MYVASNIKRVTLDGDFLTIKNQAVHLSTYLPSDEHPKPTACFTISDALADECFTVPYSQLLSWARWRVHNKGDSDRPYAFFDCRGSSAYRHVDRLAFALQSQTVEYWDWVLEEFWKHFIERCQDHIIARGYHLFSRWEDTDSFGLVSVQSGLWRNMLDFAEAFEIGTGDTSWHVFHKTHSSFCVTTCSAWSPMPTPYPAPREIEQKSRNAIHVHDWLLDKFIPAVLRWKHPSQKSLFSFFRSGPRSLEIFGMAKSLADSCATRISPGNDPGSGLARYHEDLVIRYFQHL